MTGEAVGPDGKLVTSPDGQWAAARDGRQLLLFAGAAGAPVGSVELATADVDIALVGPPNALVVLSRSSAQHGGANQIVLYTTPYLEAAARLELDTPAKLAAVTGPRLAVLAPDGKQLAIVRSAGRALSTHKVEVAGPIELAVGLERNQLLFGSSRKLEVWDAVSARPLLRAQFQLPPPPRMVGAAAGHLWAATVGSDEIFVYRLSDGRPFRHHTGAPIVDVVCHPASPIVVVVTPRGLIRLHAYAHSLTLIDGVPDRPGALAQHVVGDDISVVGFTGADAQLWRVAINGAGVASGGAAGAGGGGAGGGAGGANAAGAPGAAVAPATSGARTQAAAASRWREPLAVYAHELVRAAADLSRATAELDAPVVAIDNELGELAHRLGLSTSARRALIALYGLHLIGEPALPIASLARAIGDWPEALGQGDLGALAMLRRKHGKVALRTAVTDILDGVPPRSVRIAGGGATTPRTGAFRVSRDSRTDAELESALAGELGRIAIAIGPLRSALLEARLHGATAIAFSVPAERPRPWPRDAGLVLVLYGTNASWVADLPALPSRTA